MASGAAARGWDELWAALRTLLVDVGSRPEQRALRAALDRLAAAVVTERQ